ncbi:MAG TPA: PAS domain S-box protein [Chitinophagaceae bacterium]|nr:PAS domain S-box protein [Chitinophagaceae bacterium]
METTSINQGGINTTSAIKDGIPVLDQLRGMLSSTDIGFFLVGPDLMVLQYNDAFLRHYKNLTGNSIDRGMEITVGLPETRKQIVRDSIVQAFTGKNVEYEVKYTARSHMWIRMRYNAATDVNGRIMGVCGVVEDITVKKQLEAVARQRETEFATAFRYSGIGKALVAPDGSFIDVNPALSKLTGYSREALLQKTFQDITHPDDLERDLAFVQQMINREIETYQMEKRYFHKNGSVIWVMLTVSLVWRPDGTPHFFIAQIVDVTSIKALFHELEEKNYALDFATQDLESKMKQLEEFTHITGHNLRGGASNIKALADLMEEADPGELPLWIGRLKIAADSLLSSLTELLQFSQVKLTGEVQLESCDIEAACNDVLSQVIPPDDGEGSSVKYMLSFKTVHYSRIYLHSILYNLVSNAFKYRKPTVPLEIRVTSFLKNGRPALSIADNGVGFDAALHSDKLFTLNGTFHKGYNSKGIGLFITKAQVEKLGGKISVESTAGVGTTFTVTF